MKRITSIFKATAVKALLAVTVMLSFSMQTFAADNSWNSFFSRLQAYPAGAGKVYAEVNEDTTQVIRNADGELFADWTTPAESVDIKFTQKNCAGYGSYTAHAVPADGWIFLGYYNSNKTEDDDLVMGDSIVGTSENQSVLSIVSTIENEDSATAIGMIPAFPDTIHYAVFTRVAPAVAPGQLTLGSVKIEKNSSGDLYNDFGEDVTIVAVPNEEQEAKFAYWENKSTGEKFYDNPLTITNIQSAAYYEANFTSPNAMKIDFPAEGGYQVLTFDKGYQFDTKGMYDYQDYNMNSFQVTSSYWGGTILYMSENNTDYYTYPMESSYIMANQTLLVYGKGSCLFVRYPGDEYSDYDNPTTTSYIASTGDSEATVSSLTGNNEYYIYSIDMDKETFNLMSADDVIPVNTAYIKLPASELSDAELSVAPSVIYWEDPATKEADGISSVTVTAKNSVKKGIYTLDGKKVSKADKPGLWIMDGKKIVKK